MRRELFSHWRSVESHHQLRLICGSWKAPLFLTITSTLGRSCFRMGRRGRQWDANERRSICSSPSDPDSPSGFASAENASKYPTSSLGMGIGESRLQSCHWWNISPVIRTLFLVDTSLMNVSQKKTKLVTYLRIICLGKIFNLEDLKKIRNLMTILVNT